MTVSKLGLRLEDRKIYECLMHTSKCNNNIHMSNRDKKKNLPDAPHRDHQISKEKEKQRKTK